MKVPTSTSCGLAILAAMSLAPAPALADSHAPATESPTIAELRQGLVGSWEGALEYLDYQSGQWFGLPLRVSIEDGGDGATLIRKSIENAILTFEPRIMEGTIEVNLSAEDATGEMTVGLEIRADMWAQPMPLELYLRSKVDVTTGEIEIERTR